MAYFPKTRILQRTLILLLCATFRVMTGPTSTESANRNVASDVGLLSITQPKMICHGSTIIALTWTAADNGFSGKIRYDVLLRQQNQTGWNYSTTVTDTFVRVKDLQQDVMYKFKVIQRFGNVSSSTETEWMKISLENFRGVKSPPRNISTHNVTVDGKQPPCVRVNWQPSAEMSCKYSIHWLGSSTRTSPSHDDAAFVDILDLRAAQYDMCDLRYGREYTLFIHSDVNGQEEGPAGSATFYTSGENNFKRLS
ncbi:uncharacterized protein [Ptychodera flava]|uniref:uncharacterized protein n=1 Tax=Ptychodera flava TaxID=63121 RepID=UPI00396A4FE5